MHEEPIQPGKFGVLARKIRGGESAMAKNAKNEPAIIVITRRPNTSGFIELVPVAKTVVKLLGKQAIEIFANGTLVESLFEGEFLKIPLAVGDHVLMAKFGRKQQTVHVRCAPNTRIKIWCRLSSGQLEITDSI